MFDPGTIFFTLLVIAFFLMFTTDRLGGLKKRIGFVLGLALMSVKGVASKATGLLGNLIKPCGWKKD